MIPKIFEKQEVFSINHSSFENFVKKKYPELSEYNFALVEDCSNDSCHEFYPDGTLDLDYDDKDWYKFLQSKGTIRGENYLSFNRLCLDGHLEKNKTYLIYVCW